MDIAAPPPANSPTEAAPASPPAARSLDDRARALGFVSLADVLDALEEEDGGGHAGAMSTPAAPPAGSAAPSAPSSGAPVSPTPPAPVPPPAAASPAAPGKPPAQAAAEEQEDRRLPEHVRKKVQAARADMRSKVAAAEQAKAAAEAQAQTYQQQIAQLQAAEAMKLELVRSGVANLDFAWWAVQQHLAALAKQGDEALKGFDLKAWLPEWRKTNPHAFGETIVPANTAPAPVGSAPAAPGPGNVTGAAAGAGAFDARTATSAEIEARYKGLVGNAARGAGPAMRS